MFSVFKSRAARAAVTVVVAAIGAVVLPTAPASAGPQTAPMFIRNIEWNPVTLDVKNVYCLDQHYDAAGNATTTVFAWTPCHSVVNSPGNEQWIFELVDGHDIYRVINKRRAPDGHKWCLSAPNGEFSRVYAEWCLDPALSLAAKQKWQPLAYNTQFNHLRSLNGSGQCLENRLRDDRLAFIHICDGESYEEWSWS